MRNLNIDNYTLSKMRRYREKLTDTIQKKGISDKSVLDAIAYLPRELFIGNTLSSRAYEDTALPIDEEQTISQPYTVAYMTELLEIKPNDKVLEVGTGSGYQAGILYLLGAEVYSIERVQSLYAKCRTLFPSLGISAKLRLGDGTLGWNEYAPYDSIIITAGAPEIPANLITQLNVGGKMVVPVGDKNFQDMYLVTRTGDDSYKSEKLDSFKFVPLIGKSGWGN